MTRLFVTRTPPKTGWHVLPMEQQVDLSLFFEYHDEDDEADDAKDEHYEFYEADVDEDNLFARPWQRILIKHDRERTVRISLQ